MSTEVDVVKALGPGPALENLAQFRSSYQTTSTSFTTLLQYPLLQSIVLTPEKSSTTGDDLRSIVADGSSRFNQLCRSNIGIARTVISFSKTVPLVLKTLPLDQYASGLKPTVEQYAKEAAAEAAANEEFMKNFQAYIVTLDEQIALMASKITDLTLKISNAEVELANANVGQVIAETVKNLFKLAPGQDGQVQLAALLQVSIETLATTFNKLWEDRVRLQALLTGLNRLKGDLVKIKGYFTTLKGALSGVLHDSTSLLTVWIDVGKRMAEVGGMDRKATDLELSAVTRGWTKAQTDAQAYIDAVIGFTSTTAGRQLLSETLSASQSHVQKIPRTSGEIAVARLLVSMPDYSAALHQAVLGGAPPAAAAARALAANAAVSTSDKDKVLKSAGPPPEVQSTLNDMADKTKGIMREFNTILQLPYLNELQCVDPEKGGDNQINIQTMITNYQKMYWDLQQETVPIAQDLKTYSSTQILLLPKLVTTQTVKPGEVNVNTYLNANQTIIADYKTKADGIFNKSLAFQQKWGNAINAVVQAINTCGENIERWNKDLADFEKQYKELTLKAVLFGLGAILCFAAAAFLPGGLLVSGALVAGGIALVGLTISTLSQRSQLATAISELKARIATAKQTKARLEVLLPLMQKVGTSLSGLTTCWKDITQGLNDIETWTVLIVIPGMLDATRPELITAWTGVGAAVDKYMQIITS